jgi:Holliday junction resolvase RusA-like endonuclease
MIYELLLEPNTKPRMTRADKWKKRPCVVQYRSFKDSLRIECKRVGLTTLQPQLQSLIFHISMPDSWSKKKKSEMDGKPHQQSPDLDNLVKGFWDAILEQDNYIYSIKGELGKYWAKEGKIILIQD